MTPASDGPRWVQGRPTGEGLWLVEFVTRDVTAVRVEWDEDDEISGRYLRAHADGCSEPLDDPASEYARFAAWSFGPVPPRPTFPNE